jgi:hypothetical protein
MWELASELSSCTIDFSILRYYLIIEIGVLWYSESGMGSVEGNFGVGIGAGIYDI